MNNQPHRYLLEVRIQGEVDWRQGSSFACLRAAKTCLDATLHNNKTVLEGRLFDRKRMAYLYYRAVYPFKP